jgi:histidyl-tRNA synthetase
VRGLDYYTGLVFEIYLPGEQKALLGGGRYDKLYQEIGNIDVPAIGFALGIERLVDYLESSQQGKELVNNKVDIFFLVCDPKSYLNVMV